MKVSLMWQGSRPGDSGDMGWYAPRFGEFRPRERNMKFVASVQRDAVGDDYDPTPRSVIEKLLAKGYIPLKYVRSEYESTRLNRLCWDNVLVPNKDWRGVAEVWQTHAEFFAARLAAAKAAEEAELATA